VTKTVEIMDSEPTVSPEFLGLYLTGESLGKDLEAHLAAWPERNGHPVRGEELAPHVDAIETRAKQLVDALHSWFNLITVQVLPFTTYDRADLHLLSNRVVATVDDGGARSQHSLHSHVDG